MNSDSQRMVYANKCLRDLESAVVEWSMEFKDGDCIGAGGIKPEKGTCYPDNGVVLVENLGKREDFGHVIKDACAGGRFVGDFDDVPDYLDAIGENNKLFDVPGKVGW
jgi:hypothetical protein